ncbi:MAG: hypothetical protein JW940_07760 [Polyangiaceae bacterium]|nr:hypothetical protein [Polyangiaceae bacterium]
MHTANESARIYAALAIVDYGTLDLSPVFDRYFLRWRRTGRPPNYDVAEYEGEFRLDKAPGVSLLAVPVVAALRMLSLDPSYPALAWLLTLLLAAAPSAAALVVLYRWLERELDSAAASIAGLAVLASPWLIYGGLLFSHALSASLVAVGIPLALGPLRDSAKHASWRSTVGGLALGGAAWVDYPCLLVVALAALCIGLNRPKWRALVGFGFGATVPIAGILVWNALAFSGPFDFPYAHKSNPDLVATHTQGLLGITLPTWDALYGLVLSPRRGLLFLAPWFVAAVVGLVYAIRTKALNASWRALIVGTFVLLIAMTGAVDWHGGNAIGPRYVLFLLPLFAIATALGVVALQGAPQVRTWALWAGMGLVLSSFALNALASISYVYPDPRISNPLFEVVLPVLLQGGPGPTVWDSLLPRPVGAAIALAAGLLAVVVLVLGPCLAATVHNEAAAPGRAQKVGLVLVVSSLLHFFVAAVPSTDPSNESVVQSERAFASEFLAQDDP